MKLGLLGFPISHSRSPEIYQQLLGEKLTSYTLYEYDTKSVPDLSFFQKNLNGLNITTPYKELFISQVTVSDEVKRIGAINTLAFIGDEILGTNTDALALQKLLPRIVERFSSSDETIILGDGVLAKLVLKIGSEFGLRLKNYARRSHGDLNLLDYSSTSLVINACSRDFIFKAKLNPDATFWDFNYSSPMQARIFHNSQIRYLDGFELLELQAQEAILFWQNPTLN